MKAWTPWSLTALAARRPLLVGILGAMVAAGNLLAATGDARGKASAPDAQIALRDVITGLEVPWEILWGPDGWIWTTERSGTVSRIHPDSGRRIVLLRISAVREEGESGLLGMALHPRFADSPFVFLAYTYGEGRGMKERIVRYRYRQDTLVDPTVLVEGIEAATTHDGCRLLFDRAGKLLATTGDAQDRAAPQDSASLNGKVLRMEADGSPAAGNPDPKSRVWSKGHRNPQGLDLGPEGIVLISEHGPESDDELAVVRAGGNGGWPQVKGFCDRRSEKAECRERGVDEPLAVWTPTLAVAGIAWMRRSKVADWQGAVLVATLKGEQLILMRFSPDGHRASVGNSYLKGRLGRLRDVCVSPEGRIFVATSNRDGRGSVRSGDDRIVEIVPSQRD